MRGKDLYRRGEDVIALTKKDREITEDGYLVLDEEDREELHTIYSAPGYASWWSPEREFYIVPLTDLSGLEKMNITDFTERLSQNLFVSLSYDYESDFA